MEKVNLSATEEKASAGGHVEDLVVRDISTNAKHTSVWKEIYTHRRVLLWCFVVYILPINFGYEIGMIGKLYASPEFQHHFGRQVKGTWTIKTQHQQIINSANTIGIFVSAFCTGYLSDKFGRRIVIIIASTICCAGIVVQYFAKSVLMLFGGKLISTFGFGLGHSLGPVLVAELAPEKLRGLCLALINTMIVIGQWVGSLTVYACSFREGESAWRIPLIVQIVAPGAMLIISSTVLPESPSWLVMHDRWDDAVSALKKFNGPSVDVDSLLGRIKNAVDMEKAAKQRQEGSTWIECFRQPNLRRTTIICMVFLSQQFIGVNFIAGYLTYYFALAGVKNPLGIAQAAFAIQIVGNICSWPLIDRLGRRPMIVGGSFVMLCGLLVIGGISTLKNAASLKATVAFMTLWGFVYQATLGAVAYAVGGETPSPQYRQKTYSINMMCSTAASCLVYQVMPFLLNTDKANLGGKIAFVFLGPSVPVFIYLYLCLPEMKGRSIDELEEMFQDRVPARKFKNHQCRLTEERKGQH